MFKPVQIFIEPRLIESLNRYLDNYSVGQRTTENGTRTQQLHGLIGECETHRFMLGEYPNFRNKSGFDGGYDLEFNGLKFDVKTITTRYFAKPDYEHSVYGMQMKYKAEAFVFCNYNETCGVLEICGAMSKNRLLDQGTFYENGSVRKLDSGKRLTLRQDNYYIKNYLLTPIQQILTYADD